uniref:hypothetical protein n=1 Tax=Xanthomonas albilineans TaxID=29447 RepID=UPI0027DB093A|nr:hypothetical protein [Xanthomonas albilineans]
MMEWSPDFRISKGKGARIIRLGVDDKSVWAGIVINGQSIAFDSTRHSHKPLSVQIYADCICICMHIKVQRGYMAPIVVWLRKHGVEVDIDADSVHAPDLIELTASQGNSR